VVGMRTWLGSRGVFLAAGVNGHKEERMRKEMRVHAATHVRPKKKTKRKHFVEKKNPEWFQGYCLGEEGVCRRKGVEKAIKGQSAYH